MRDGHEVYIISAVKKVETWGEDRDKILRWIRDVMGDGNYTGIFLVPIDEKSKRKAYDAGLLKAKVMKRLEIFMLIDDNDEVLKAVRDQGFATMHIMGGKL